MHREHRGHQPRSRHFPPLQNPPQQRRIGQVQQHVDDPETGRDLLTHVESSAAQRQAEANWRQAETRIAELEAFLRERDVRSS